MKKVVNYLIDIGSSEIPLSLSLIYFIVGSMCIYFIVQLYYRKVINPAQGIVHVTNTQKAYMIVAYEAAVKYTRKKRINKYVKVVIEEPHNIHNTSVKISLFGNTSIALDHRAAIKTAIEKHKQDKYLA